MWTQIQIPFYLLKFRDRYLNKSHLTNEKNKQTKKTWHHLLSLFYAEDRCLQDPAELWLIHSVTIKLKHDNYRIKLTLLDSKLWFILLQALHPHHPAG